MNDEKILWCRDVSKSFESGEEKIAILEDVNLDLYRGRSVSITGKSGCGKSTLLHILGSLLSPDSGNVYFENEDLYAGCSQAQIRSTRMGFVFQDALLLEDFSTIENVMLPLRLRRTDERKARSTAMEYLERVGMADRADHDPLKLSGGERQRVAICRALIQKPDIIFADEPTGSLDEENARMAEDLLLSMAHDDGATLLLVTHNSDFAQRCDEGYVLTSRNLRKV